MLLKHHARADLVEGHTFRIEDERVTLPFPRVCPKMREGHCAIDDYLRVKALRMYYEGTR